MKNITLTAARKQSGKTQKQVAEEIGTTEVAYRNYEHGRTTPNAIMGNKIARILETTSEKLWGYELPKTL